MKTSKVFYSDRYKRIESAIRDLLNAQPVFLSERTAGSPRAVGDAIEEIVCDHFQAVLGDMCQEYSAAFARRAMADLAFKDFDGLYYVVDVKTHRLEAGFHMPNLTSVERLTRFYEDDHNCFVVLHASYRIVETKVTVERVHFIPIEFISWQCLTIGALGWGQIQIADANKILINDGYSRRKWMLELCERMLEFYPSEIQKIDGRVLRFRQIQEYWRSHAE